MGLLRMPSLSTHGKLTEASWGFQISPLARLARQKRTNFMIKRLMLLIILGLWLTACDGGDDKKDDTPPTQPAPTSTLTGEEGSTDGRPVESYDTSNMPMPRGILTKDNLTVVASSYFVKGEMLYVGLLVRNDNDTPVRYIKVLLSTIDADNLRLDNYNITSTFNNIPSGQTIALQGVFPAGTYYDSISALVIANFEDDGQYAAYHDGETSAELDAATSTLRGAAVNTSTTPQPLQVAYFVLYGANENDLLGVIPALPTAGLEQGIWQPGATINYQATVAAIAGDDISAVKQVELMVAGYSLSAEN